MANIRTQKKGKKTPASVFLATTIVVFFLSLSTADSVGFVPDYIDGGSSSVPLSDLPQLGDTSVQVLPEHLTIPAVGIDLPVQNPATRDVDTLDQLLKQGPARYSASATLGQSGTMIIFAHSSHLPIVRNKMFQAFNAIPDLKQGDSITLRGSDGRSYFYSVVSVVRADVNDGTKIDISPAAGTRLVLVTCDTLTGKSARYVLTADFVGVVGA